MITYILLLLSVLLLGAGLCRIFARRHSLIASNAYGGTRLRHESLTLELNTNITQRYILATFGTNEGQCKICAATDRPIGFFNDEGVVGDSISIERGSHKTALGIAAVAIAIGDKLYSAQFGEVSNVAASGSYFVGVALTPVSGADATLGGDSAIVEYEPVGVVADAQA